MDIKLGLKDSIVVEGLGAVITEDMYLSHDFSSGDIGVVEHILQPIYGVQRLLGVVVPHVELLGEVRLWVS